MPTKDIHLFALAPCGSFLPSVNSALAGLECPCRHGHVDARGARPAVFAD